MPSCQGVWSSRDPVGAEHLEAFREVAGQAVEEGVDPSRAVLALTTAHGVLATAVGARWDDLGASDLLVVMDVDPVKGVMLLAGPKEASCWTGVLFLVMRHRGSVNAALFEAPEQTDAPEAGHVRELDPNGPLEATRSGGWGFEESGVPAHAARQGTMVEWASRALEGLKVDNVVAWEGGSLVTGDRLPDLVPLRKKVPKDRGQAP